MLLQNIPYTVRPTVVDDARQESLAQKNTCTGSGPAERVAERVVEWTAKGRNYLGCLSKVVAALLVERRL